MQTIKHWCINVEAYLNRLEKRDIKMPAILSEDYQEFVKSQHFLSDFMKTTYVYYVFIDRLLSIRIRI